MVKEKLNSLIAAKKSMLCIGLDPDLEKIPPLFLKMSDPVAAFNRAVIEATHQFAVAYKPNFAFYESRGAAGLGELERTLEFIPETCITIADAKRADIGNTSKHYATAFFEIWKFDCVTVPPYMGYDSISPFLSYSDKLTFILCLTSNSGSQDFEEAKLENGQRLYERVLEKAVEWNKSGNVGVVVGATKPEQLAELRKAAPGLVFLIPGVGAQGGDLRAAVRNGIDANGGSALINLSRAILYDPAQKSASGVAVNDLDTFKSLVAVAAEQTVTEMRTHLP